MGRRLALLTEGLHRSPWTWASGYESEVLVKGLGKGRIEMKVYLKNGAVLDLSFSEGVTGLKPFNPGEWVKYQVCKSESNGGSMTSVEVLLASHH